MNHLELLIPFGLPSEMASDLLRQLKAPSLAMLISRAAHAEQSFDGFSRALPHEIWLAERAGGAVPRGHDSSPPMAALALRTFGLTPEPGVWFIVNPAHLHVARDHLVLTDLRQLACPDDEARALFAAAEPVFAESGMALRYGDAQTWLLRADQWCELRTSTPDAACGHNIDIWMPTGDGERNWRKLHNEIQMLWHTHAVNEQRAARGAKPINALWLWGGASSDRTTPDQKNGTPTQVSAGYSAAEASDRARIASGWPLRPSVRASQVIASSQTHGTVVLDTLSEPALAGDWGLWLERVHALESEWFAPLLAAVDNGKLDRLSLTMSHAMRLATFSFSKSSGRKFWVRPSLTRLAP